MLNLLLIIVIFFGGVLGYDAPVGSHVDLCNGISVDNVDKVLYLYASAYIVHFKFDNALTWVIILDDCFTPYSAYEISPNGIVRVEF